MLDVSAGSGILSFFAVRAGAKQVYAIEACNMAKLARDLVAANHVSDKIDVIPEDLEEVVLPQMVDIIIWEPMGYMIFNKQMRKIYLHARKWLKPDGKMFPAEGNIYIAPFTDEALYKEQLDRANFW